MAIVNHGVCPPSFDVLEARTRQESITKNFGGSTAKQQFIGGNPLTAFHLVLPSTASVAGTTEQWINSKASGVAAAQLTIFYAGNVKVFDGISPEKAQAIMFLAGSGYVGQSKVNVEAAASKVVCSGLPSPMSDESANINDAVKTTGCKVEPQAQRIVSVAATAMISSAVPQARKASLARFLEKRKERVKNAAAPYNLGKKAGDCGTPDSNGGFSATSSVYTSKDI
ncbi:hypothetical protein CDL12_05550 [Handroanthus impetiginosus]|uniref:Protein TIFY n=1 Tax=Handroanthus impetiginosus TaxID=429701 RepID=A0A2G9HWN5_9LAMI|nr:hypothetical protein CDL12_05550 [Handroanthus impetiginosus]